MASSLSFQFSSYSATLKNDTLPNYFIYNYLYSRDYKKLNFCLSTISDLEKEKLLLAIGDYYLNKKNFVCNNIIQNKYGVKFYDTIIQTEILNLSFNWRLQEELILILIHDIKNGLVRELETLRLSYRFTYFYLYKGDKERYLMDKTCWHVNIKKYYNYKNFKRASRSCKKWLKGFKEGKYKLNDSIGPISFCEVTIKNIKSP